MAKDTDHTRIELSPEIKTYKFEDAVTEYKGEISIWSHLPTDIAEDEAHIVIGIDAVWGHDSRYVEITPEQARDIARALNARADEVEAYDMQEEHEQVHAEAD